MSYPKPRKISYRWLAKRIDCTPEGRKICKGLCCKLPHMYAFYHPSEISKVPKELRKYLVWDEKEKMYKVKKLEDGRTCAFIDYCFKNPEMKPIFCWLFPLKIDKRGVLVMHRWAPLHCPNYGKGQPAWIVFKEGLIRAFGKKFYEEKIRYKMTFLQKIFDAQEKKRKKK